MYGLLYRPNFILKCVAWIFCLIVIILVNNKPYRQAHLPPEPWKPINPNWSWVPEGYRERHKRLHATDKYNVIVSSPGAYFLILPVFIFIYIVSRPAWIQTLIFLSTGAVLNICAGAMEVLHESTHKDVTTTDLAIMGSMILMAGITMFLDTMIFAIIGKSEEEDEEEDEE